MHAVASRPGLVVVDNSLHLVASNEEAIQILTFPDRAEKINHLPTWLLEKIKSRLVERRSQSSCTFATEFRSARRTYVCRSFPMNVNVNGTPPSNPLLVLMLERRGKDPLSMIELSQRFGLTTREQETVQYLLQGLTSKEIAEQMKISPNTVKAFIRLVMVKMNVSTRSGILGKIVDPRDQGRPSPGSM